MTRIVWAIFRGVHRGLKSLDVSIRWKLGYRKTALKVIWKYVKESVDEEIET